MIATALSLVAHAVGTRRAERARSAAALRTTSVARTATGTTRVFHPMGAIRLVTPAEEHAQDDMEMANFGTRLAHPRPEAHVRAHAAPATPTGVMAALRRALRGLLRSIDDAPFDLAWPPSHRRWPTNEPAWRADQPGGAMIAEAPRRRRAA